VYSIQAFEKWVRVLKNVHFDHVVSFVSRVLKNGIKVLKIVAIVKKKVIVKNCILY